jgi:hypothetical protein
MGKIRIKKEPLNSTGSPIASLNHSADVTNTRAVKTDSNKVISLLAAILGVLAPALYFAGYLYADGYIAALSLQSDLYARSPDQYITKSFFGIFEGINKLAPHFATWVKMVIGLVIIFIALMGFAYYLSKARWLQMWILSRTEKWGPATKSKLLRVILQSVFFGFLAVYLPLLVAVLLLVYALPFHSLGVEAAYSKIDKFVANGSCTPSKIEPSARNPTCLKFTSKELPEPIDGFILLSSDKAITVYDAKTNTHKTFFPKEAIMIEGAIRSAPTAKPSP